MTTVRQNDCTYIICDMSDREKILLTIGGDHEVRIYNIFVAIVLLIYHHIVWVYTSEGDKLLIITVGCCFPHFLQTDLECNINIFWGRREGLRRGIGRDIFTLWVTSNTPARVDSDKGLVFGSIVSHMVDDTGPDLITALLVAKYLIRKGGKEAVAYSGEKQLAKINREGSLA